MREPATSVSALSCGAASAMSPTSSAVAAEVWRPSSERRQSDGSFESARTRRRRSTAPNTPANTSSSSGRTVPLSERRCRCCRRVSNAGEKVESRAEEEMETHEDLGDDVAKCVRAGLGAERQVAQVRERALDELLVRQVGRRRRKVGERRGDRAYVHERGLRASASVSTLCLEREEPRCEGTSDAQRLER